MNFDPIQAIGTTFSRALGHNNWLINLLRPAYEAGLTVYHGDRGIPWIINGETYRIDPRYRQLMGHDWDPEVAKFLLKRISPSAVCLDVGANAGIYVLQLCRWAPKGRVIAFEPNPSTETILKRHIRMNGLGDRVIVAPLAISDHEGEAEFYFAGASGMSRLGKPNSLLAKEAKCTKVKVTTLDTFCRENDIEPDLLLMDIEGFEFEALKGSSKLIASRSKLDIIVEFHPSVWPQSTTRADWQRFLSEHGFKTVIPLSGQRDVYQDTGSVYLGRE